MAKGTRTPGGHCRARARALREASRSEQPYGDYRSQAQVGKEMTMSQGIYITSAEPRSGKSVVVLGVMELLSGRMGKVGFFRPVVLDDRKPDAIVNLIIKRYGL